MMSWLSSSAIAGVVRSAWHKCVEAKHLVDSANREVDDILKTAWYEFRNPCETARGSVLDTVLVVAALSVLLLILTTPTTRALLHDLLVNALR